MIEITVTVIILGWLAAFVLFAPPRFLSRYRFPPVTDFDTDRKDSLRHIRISCIIPARNEERRIAPLLESIAAQTLSPVEVIVVDDDSSDNTASLARSYGAQVVSAGPRPEGWAGKPWACQQGARAASGDIYIFLDSDVILEGEALSRISQTLQPGNIISVQPFHVAPTITEKLSALFNLQSVASIGLGTTGPLGPSRVVTEEPMMGESAAASQTSCRRSPGACLLIWAERILGREATGGLFGPVIAVHALDYEAFDGHRRVSGSILEDVHLGTVAREAGITTRTWLGAGLARFRMYPDGFRELLDGWTKNFVAGARTTSTLTLTLQALFISGAATVSAQTAFALLDEGTISLTAALIAYAAYTGLLATVLPAYGSFRTATAALFPLHLLFYFAVCLRAFAFQFAHQEVVWRGRKIEAERARAVKPPRRISPRRA